MKKTSLLALLSLSAGLVLASCGGETPAPASTEASKEPSAESSVPSKESEPSTPSAESEPSTPSAESEPEESKESEPISEVTYYLVGSINGWAKSEEYAFSHAILDGYEDQDMYALEVSLTAGDELKVTSSESKWYPDGMGNNYVVEETGDAVVYFCPDGGLEDFYCGFFKVVITEPGEDTRVTVPVELSVTNFDPETMQVPQLVWGVEGATNYFNSFTAAEDADGLFTGELTFPASGKYVCKVATWGLNDPWPEYNMFALADGSLAEIDVQEGNKLVIAGELGLVSEGGGIGTFTMVPANE